MNQFNQTKKQAQDLAQQINQKILNQKKELGKTAKENNPAKAKTEKAENGKAKKRTKLNSELKNYKQFKHKNKPHGFFV